MRPPQDSNERGVNEMMLVLARESRGMSQVALAEKSGVAQATISKAEHGQVILSADVLGRISAALDYPLEFFSCALNFQNLPLSFFRKKSVVTPTAIKMLRARYNIALFRASQLAKSAELPEFPFASLDLDQYAGDIERIAREVRLAMNLPPGPVKDLTGALESLGVLILTTDFGTTKADGLSAFDPAGISLPVILLNRIVPADRYRYTLAHEFGHVILQHHRGIPPGSCEEEADRFAGEFLTPAREVRAHLAKLSLQKLANLKLYWRVSMQSLLFRAGQLGTISERQRRYLWMQISARGYRTAEPVAIEPEQPTLYGELLRFHKDALGYSDPELVSLLCLGASDLTDYFSSQGGLRRVK
jgi:Zn-dependent peptidase ImmA (M78 family)/transcriptional regulator with XRE-family HTH domain